MFEIQFFNACLSDYFLDTLETEGISCPFMKLMTTLNLDLHISSPKIHVRVGASNRIGWKTVSHYKSTKLYFSINKEWRIKDEDLWGFIICPRFGG